MGAITDYLNKWCEERNAELIANYNAKGLKASGKFERELRYTADESGAQILAPIHVGAMVGGRVKSSNTGSGESLRSVIRKWIDDKGITPYADKKGRPVSKDSLAYLITRKIHTRGIQVPNKYNDGQLIKEVITQDKIDELLRQIGGNYITEFKNEIQETWR
jgi:hypothetical protein